MITPFYQDTDYNHFRDLKAVLDANLRATHRINPVYPEDYTGPDPVGTYLKGTPLANAFEILMPFAIPEAKRFEHTYLIGGTGQGKTTALKYFIAKDLADIAAREKSAVVIDSQGALIPELLAVDFPNDRIVLIDPEDIAHPLCLNLFASARSASASTARSSASNCGTRSSSSTSSCSPP